MLSTGTESQEPRLIGIEGLDDDPPAVARLPKRDRFAKDTPLPGAADPGHGNRPVHLERLKSPSRDRLARPPRRGRQRIIELQPNLCPFKSASGPKLGMENRAEPFRVAARRRLDIGGDAGDDLVVCLGHPPDPIRQSERTRSKMQTRPRSEPRSSLHRSA